ncbi:replication initiator protein A [Secundilactobacillus collinoides]|uniref:Plasmid replication initiation protein n=6 Tax=Lactobacillales TaxID=186826 RepID=A0A166HWA0_SECCO|nr:replication initiator protein A [Secundilactobacillus collinoides]KZL43279.1 plasmid replication initiation protein [Secundilactobacillus collinoides]
MDQSNFNFTNAKRAYEVKFYALPQILLQGEKYKDLSDSAILLYSVLRDRLSYSLSNNWVDENNNVYFIYTNNELKDLRNWSNNKINKIKHELMDANLLYQKHMGFNPRSGKNEPNRLYLADLEVTAKDVYIKREPTKSPESLGTSGLLKKRNPHDTVSDTPESLGTSGLLKKRNPYDTVEPLGTSGLLKKRNPHDTVSDTSESLGTSGLLKKRQDLDYTNNIDTDRYNIDTQKLDFSTAQFSPAELEKQNKDLINHANDFLTDEDSGLPVFLEPEAVQLLSFWCRTPQQMRRFIGIILNAKYRVEEDHKDIGVLIPLDDEELKPLMTKVLRRYFNVLRSNEKHVKDVENYLYGTMQNLFGVWWNKQAAKEYAAKHSDNYNANNERF